jgi:hypothetical protein
MVYLRAECAFILERYFTSELLAAVNETFVNACPDKEVSNKTKAHQLVTVLQDTGSVCL